MSVLDLEQTPGRCAFCDKPFPPVLSFKPCSVVCRDPECRRQYLAAWYAQRRGIKRQEVVEVFGSSSTGWFSRLACGHAVPAPKPNNRRAKRRGCPDCRGVQQ